MSALPTANAQPGLEALLGALGDLRDARINYKAAKERYGEEVERLAKFKRRVERAQFAFNTLMTIHTGDTEDEHLAE